MADISFPSLPTDNLYKFLALSGTAIVLATMYLITTWTLTVWDHATEALEAVELSTARLESAKRKLDLFGTLIDNSIADRNGTRKHDPSKLELTYSDDEIKAMRNSIVQESEAMALENVKVKVASRRITDQHAQLIALCVIGAPFMFVGSMMMITGFRFWYSRVQVPMDAQICRGIKLVEQSDATDKCGQMGEDGEGI
jgi:hypothetical protein